MTDQRDDAGLTITDEETIRLLVRLADMTGDTLTDTLLKALRESSAREAGSVS